MKRNNQELKLIFIILTIITALSVIIAVGFGVLFFKSEKSVPTSAVTSDEDSLAQKESAGGDGGEGIKDREQIKLLEEENKALRAEAESLAEELRAWEQTGNDGDDSQKAEHQPDDSTISGSFDPGADFDPGQIQPADPASLSYTFNLTEQLARIRALEEQMQHVPFLVSPEGELVSIGKIEFDRETEIIYRAKENSPLDDDGKPLETEIDYEAMGYTTPVVALSYRDLERGTSYAYNGDRVYFSASLIKAPYVYALLHQIAQYNAIKAANPTNDPNVGKTLPKETIEKYDLQRKITVTESMKAEGSGKIKDMDLSGGKEFTVLELIEYAISVSDNTAFRVLRNEFGYDYFWSVSKALGIESVFTSFNNMTANEACIYLAAIYDFAKEYPTEGGILISLMKRANHQVLIPQAVQNPANAAHKYGWDADSYHDMAIVYGDAPYAICVMTNFDFAVSDNDINAYIRSLVKEMEAIHQNFYIASKNASF